MSDDIRETGKHETGARGAAEAPRRGAAANADPDDEQQLVEAAISEVLARRPGLKRDRLFRIRINGDDTIYLGYRTSYDTFSKAIKGLDRDPAAANPLIIERFLVHPQISVAEANLMLPGKVVDLAKGIQRGNGFAEDEVRIESF